MKIIGGIHKNRKIITPKGLLTRPTSSRLRESVFNICQWEIEGATFLDLFAGSGAIGLEALSRGAAQVVFVDQDKESIRCIKENIENFEWTNSSQVIHADVFKALERFKDKKFQIIYADPPYNKGFAQLVLNKCDQDSLLNSNGMLFLEEDKNVTLNCENLKNLTLKSSRLMGPSILYQLENK